MDILLHEGWTLLDGDTRYPCQVPCSVYDTLITAGAIADPYVGENQWDATAVCDRDFVFEKTFDLPETAQPAERMILRFDGMKVVRHIDQWGEYQKFSSVEHCAENQRAHNYKHSEIQYFFHI